MTNFPVSQTGYFSAHCYGSSRSVEISGHRTDPVGKARHMALPGHRAWPGQTQRVTILAHPFERRRPRVQRRKPLRPPSHDPLCTTRVSVDGEMCVVSAVLERRNLLRQLSSSDRARRGAGTHASQELCPLPRSKNIGRRIEQESTADAAPEEKTKIHPKRPTSPSTSSNMSFNPVHLPRAKQYPSSRVSSASCTLLERSTQGVLASGTWALSEGRCLKSSIK